MFDNAIRVHCVAPGIIIVEKDNKHYTVRSAPDLWDLCNDPEKIPRRAIAAEYLNMKTKEGRREREKLVADWLADPENRRKAIETSAERKERAQNESVDEILKELGL